MEKYKIKYNYNTGDSFGHQDGLESYLDMTWKNVDVAKANLKRIEEHYKQYKELTGYSWDKDRTHIEILDDNHTKDWFVQKKILVVYKPGEEKRRVQLNKTEDKKYWEEKGYVVKNSFDTADAEYCIILYTDDNKPWQICAPWCGYFESLNYVEIVPDTSDMKIEF